MKQIIPFTKDITFKNTIGDLVSISLDNDLQLKGEDLITGNFYVKGKYKLTKASIQEEEYSYKIPCEIAISDDYDTFDATIDIDDFYYDIIDNEVLRINIDLVIDNLVKKEVKEKEEVSVRKEEQEVKEIKEENLYENAKKNFKGTIDFKKGCKKAKGNENEYCTILSDKAKSIALPMLLCTEEDVEGNHATAAGKIDSKKLFYLMTRGLSKADSERLIVRAQFNSVIEMIENEEVKSKLLKKIDEL